MAFEIDQQTLQDLELFREDKGMRSIFSLFNKTSTPGGKDKLNEMLASPSADITFLYQRSELLKFFIEHPVPQEVDPYRVELAEHYMRLTADPLRDNIIDATYQGLKYKWKPTNEYYLIKTGIEQITFLLHYLSGLIKGWGAYSLPEQLRQLIAPVQALLQQKKIQAAVNRNGPFNFYSIATYDHLFRELHRNELTGMLQLVYTLDAGAAIALTACKYQLTFPVYTTAATPMVVLHGVFHPLVNQAVPNDITLADHDNLCFLTGPNMAGKSTFLKSVGLSVYLAHTGFPVPARYMETTVFSGIITTINLADNISKGYSHYYSEVKRVKDTALKIQQRKHVFVIFDELFRGTNVKDAYDASLQIISLLAQIKSAVFLISTHIIEIADQLKKHPNILFRYFESDRQLNSLTYSYKIKEGVSAEKLGMLIVQQENILDILQAVIQEQQAKPSAG